MISAAEAKLRKARYSSLYEGHWGNGNSAPHPDWVPAKAIADPCRPMASITIIAISRRFMAQILTRSDVYQCECL